MSLETEIYMLLQSDVSSAAVDQLTTKFGLWVRNTLLHFSFGLVGYFLHTFRPDLSAWITGCFWAYVGLQVLQLFSQGVLGAIALDGAWDVLVVLLGYAVAWWMASKEVSQ